MSLFRSRVVDHTVLDELSRTLGRRPEILAWGKGTDGTAVGLRDCLALHRAGEWQIIGWHLIVHGGFRPEPRVLWWELIDGDAGQLRLDDPERLPEVFRERVTASIAVQQQVEVPSGGQAIISARRNLADDSLTWNVLAVGRTDLAEPATRQFLTDATTRLRDDYDR